MPVWAILLEIAHFVSFAWFLFYCFLFFRLTTKFTQVFNRDPLVSKGQVDELKDLTKRIRAATFPTMFWLVVTFVSLLLFTYGYAVPHSKGLL